MKYLNQILEGVAYSTSRLIHTPSIENLHIVPTDRQFILVGNHGCNFATETAYILEALRNRNIKIAALGHDFLFKSKPMKKLLNRMGVYSVSPENFDDLIEDGYSILLYPGGARECLKTKDNAYQLSWENRYGFAKRAVKYNIPIVPFATVGNDEHAHTIAVIDTMTRTKMGNYLWQSFDGDCLLRKMSLKRYYTNVIVGKGFAGLPKIRVKYNTKFGSAVFPGSFTDTCQNKQIEAIKTEVQNSVQKMLDQNPCLKMDLT